MKKYFIILVTVLSFSACNDGWLEVTNHSQLDASTLLTTEVGLNLAVNAAYTPLGHGNLFGLSYLKEMNTLDPYVWFEAPKAGLDIFSFDTRKFQGQWRDLYFGVFRTTDIIRQLPALDGVVSSSNITLAKAQMCALRGMYNFYLLTWFNAPIFYDENSMPADPLAAYKNGTQEQIWDLIEKDLRFAADNLPAAWASTQTGRITSGGANGQLGKALLYKHYHYYLRFAKVTTETKANLELAKAAFKKVMDSGNYELIQPKAATKKDYEAALLSNSSYLDIPVGVNTYKAENNKESVWEIQYNDDSRGGKNLFLPAWQSGGSLNYQYFAPLGEYRNFEIDPTLWFEFETVSGHPVGYTIDPRAYATCFLDGDTLDWRVGTTGYTPFVSGTHTKKIVEKNSLYAGAEAAPSVALGVKKYCYPQYTTAPAPFCAPFNIRVIRYADVLLMYAETCLQIDGDIDGSGLSALNSVRTRVGMPTIGALTHAAIIHERTVELATEGHQYDDIIRFSFDPAFGIDFAKIYKGYFQNPRHLYFPIPQSEIDVNRGALKQNPGW